MPIYQYKCANCGHQMEALQKMSDPKLIDCPSCAAPALKKQVTAAAFKLKGTGWYETDFKNSGKKPAVNANKSEGSAAKSGSSVKGASPSSGNPESNSNSTESASASTASSD